MVGSTWLSPRHESGQAVECERAGRMVAGITLLLSKIQAWNSSFAIRGRAACGFARFDRVDAA
jgi:hypothetical protein